MANEMMGAGWEHAFPSFCHKIHIGVISIDKFEYLILASWVGINKGLNLEYTHYLSYNYALK